LERRIAWGEGKGRGGRCGRCRRWLGREEGKGGGEVAERRNEGGGGGGVGRGVWGEGEELGGV